MDIVSLLKCYVKRHYTSSNTNLILSCRFLFVETNRQKQFKVMDVVNVPASETQKQFKVMDVVNVPASATQKQFKVMDVVNVPAGATHQTDK